MGRVTMASELLSFYEKQLKERKKERKEKHEQLESSKVKKEILGAYTGKLEQTANDSQMTSKELEQQYKERILDSYETNIKQLELDLENLNKEIACIYLAKAIAENAM